MLIDHEFKGGLCGIEYGERSCELQLVSVINEKTKNML
jgi:hypothetical protein